MHVAVRELAVLAVAVAAGSAEAFAPTPSGLARLRAAPSVGLSTCERGLPSARRDVAPALGATALQAVANGNLIGKVCLLYTSPSPRDQRGSRMPSSA